jgi:hypothetical protein
MSLSQLLGMAELECLIIVENSVKRLKGGAELRFVQRITSSLLFLGTLLSLQLHSYLLPRHDAPCRSQDGVVLDISNQ